MRVNGNFYVTENAYMTSDERSKENIEPIESSPNKVLGIRGVSYKRKKEDSKGGASENRHYGVIWQEVEKVLPEIVANGDNGSKSVAYIELVPVLIEATKEQQKKISELNKKVNELERKLRLKGNMAMVGSN